MRLSHTMLAVAAILAGGLAIWMGGQRLAGDQTVIEIDAPQDFVAEDEAGLTDESMTDPAKAQTDGAQTSVDALRAQPEPASPANDRGDASSGTLERVAPRGPLSELALANRPKPKAWKDAPLFQPVAPAAGEIEAEGFSIVLSGLEVTQPDASCADDAGRQWACGLRARTAFRAFLRNRAVTCTEPEAHSGPPVAQCRVGGEDIGQWLVENGWARAEAGGPYADLGRKAQEAKKGIFGPAPDVSGLPPEPSITVAPLPDATRPSSILDLSGSEPTPQAFPPAPAE